MKPFCKFFLISLLIFGTIYLLLPSHNTFPDLPGAVKSIEPGDSTQIANVSAYYTDMARKDVVDFYFKHFFRSPFLNIPLITYKLNHPPERIREVLRDTQQSTYVEEIVHPFRESVYINGFEWDNDPFTPPARRIKNILIVNGKEYQFKVTLFYQPTFWWQKLLVFYLAMALGFCLIKEAGKLIKRLKNHAV